MKAPAKAEEKPADEKVEEQKAEDPKDKEPLAENQKSVKPIPVNKEKEDPEEDHKEEDKKAEEKEDDISDNSNKKRDINIFRIWDRDDDNRINNNDSVDDILSEKKPYRKKKPFVDRDLLQDDNLIENEEQDNYAKAESFIKSVYTFNYARRRFLKVLKNELEKYNDRVLSVREHNIVNAIKPCYDMLSSNDKTPRQMYYALSNMKSAISHFNEDAGIRTMVMAGVLYETMRPLITLDKFYPLTSTNGVEMKVGDLYRSVELAGETYHIPKPVKGTVREAYAVVEDRAKARLILNDTLEKACGKTVLVELSKWNPDDSILETRSPKNMHEKAKNCVAKAFLDKAQDPNVSTETINGLTAVIRNKGFEDQVNELEKNVIFQSVATKYPNHYYSHWKKVLDRAEEKKMASSRTLQDLTMHVGNVDNDGFVRGGGLAGYVAYGNRGVQSENSRNARLARVLGTGLLADPQFGMLRQAVAANKITEAEVMIEAMAYVERNHIRVLDRQGNIDQNFRRKLENGDFRRDLVRSQNSFLKQAKQRKDADKIRLQEKLQVRQPQGGPMIIG